MVLFRMNVGSSNKIFQSAWCFPSGLVSTPQLYHLRGEEQPIPHLVIRANFGQLIFIGKIEDTLNYKEIL